MIPSPPRDKDDPRALARLKGQSVLVVDDDTETLNALRRLLRDMPYKFLSTDRPYKALDWVGASNVSLVITDQRMPEMLGTRLLQEVARRSPATARFLLTGYYESQEVLEAVGRVVQGVITKPWDGQALKRTILAILRWQDERVHTAGSHAG